MDVIYRTVTSLFLSLLSAIGIQAAPMTWQMQPIDGRTVQVILSTHPHSSQSETIFIERFDGLKPLLQLDGPAKFRLKRDAGVFEFDGVLRRGAGGGTLEFVPSEAFVTELAKRGFEKPTRDDLFKMAWHDTGFALVDELAAQKYQKPTLPQLIDAGDHGIDRAYLRELAALGYQVGTVDALIRLHDHAIDGGYIRLLSTLGLTRLSADDLVRAHDHDIGGEYVRDLQQAGYRLSLDDLVRAHDHGISAAYAGKANARRFRRLSLDELVSLHDHGQD
jgi:hypothetical protein